MGVGYPEDLVVCVALGVDMFDCVYPTRTARFGNAFTDLGTINLKKKDFKFDFDPIDSNCDCEACTYYTKSYLNSIISKEETASHLLTKHNIRYLLRLMARLRESIMNDTFE